MKNVHFAIPEIYGETLSYYELLRKIIDKTNELIENYNTVPYQISEEVKKLDAYSVFTTALNWLIHSIATDNTKSKDAVKQYKKHDLLYATFNDTVNLYEAITDFTNVFLTELKVGKNIREVNISELIIELRNLIDTNKNNIEAVKNVANENSEQITTINGDITNIENKNNEQDIELSTLRTMLSSPYNFKGEVSSLSALPASGNINDTYYVLDVKYKVTWTGSAWVQSSLSEADYQTELSELKGDLANEIKRAKGRENDIESLFTTPALEQVDRWLDEHPEATTTVQDGSLTYKKLVVGTLGFVTPEMFGAVGDGDTDDYMAIQNAIVYAQENKKNVVLDGNYRTSKELIIESPINIIGKGSVFRDPEPYGKSSRHCAFYSHSDNVTIKDITIKSEPEYTPSLDVINGAETDYLSSNIVAVYADKNVRIEGIKTEYTNGVSCLNGAVVSVDNCIFDHAYIGIYSDNSTVTVNNCRFLMENISSTYYHALYVKNGSVFDCENCKFTISDNNPYVGPFFAERNDDGVIKKSRVKIARYEVIAPIKRLYFTYYSKEFILSNGIFISTLNAEMVSDFGKSYENSEYVLIDNCIFNAVNGYFDTTGVETVIQNCNIKLSNVTASIVTGGNVTVIGCTIEYSGYSMFVARPILRTVFVNCTIICNKGYLRFNTPTSLTLFVVANCIFIRNGNDVNSANIFYSTDFTLYRVANNVFYGKIQNIYDSSHPTSDNSFINNTIN